MRASLVRLASSVTSQPLKLQEASASLLPPLPLYRRILRAHRILPREMRLLGDDYVKAGTAIPAQPRSSRFKTHAFVHTQCLSPPVFAEFRRHRSTDNPLHIIGFISEWKLYLDQLESTKGTEFRGKPLDPTLLETMSSEQIGQLYELMHATRDIWKTPEELGKQGTKDGDGSRR
ncbi:acetate non-utilizing protein 9 [Tulasnella sp. 425]|nr:acetate non-utilizing protein 9 [Tulasnella sp. 425]